MFLSSNRLSILLLCVMHCVPFVEMSTSEIWKQNIISPLQVIPEGASTVRYETNTHLTLWQYLNVCRIPSSLYVKHNLQRLVRNKFARICLCNTTIFHPIHYILVFALQSKLLPEWLTHFTYALFIVCIGLLVLTINIAEILYYWMLSSRSSHSSCYILLNIHKL